MMKKLRYLLFVILLPAFIAVGCDEIPGDDKDDDNNTEEIARVSKIVCSGSANVEFAFRYDDAGRITEYNVTEKDNGSTVFVYRFDHSVASQITVTNGRTSNEKWVAHINSAGQANKIEKHDDYAETCDEFSMFYTDGYLVKEEWKDYSNETKKITYEWNNGNFSEARYHYEEWSYETMGQVWKYDVLTSYATYTDTANAGANIDLNMLVQTFGGNHDSGYGCNGVKYGSCPYNEQCMDILALFGYLGKGSGYMVKELGKLYKAYQPSEPEKQSHIVAQTRSEEFTRPVCTYALDGEGRIKTITCTTADFDGGVPAVKTYTVTYQ